MASGSTGNSPCALGILALAVSKFTQLLAPAIEEKILVVVDDAFNLAKLD